LEAAGVPSAACDAAALVAHVVGCVPTQLGLHAREVLPTAAARRLASLAARRAAREPLQLILEGAPFHDLSLRVTPGVFIPRPETEGLAQAALDAVAAAEAPIIVDLCAGAGPLAVFLAARRRDASVIAVEIDRDACEDIRFNAGRYDAAVEILSADIRDPLLGKQLPAADLIVSNPPYIPAAIVADLPPEVRVWENVRTQDGGRDGLDFYRVISRLAAEGLKAGGFLAVEIGEEQAVAAIAILSSLGAAAVGRDLAGRDRYVTVRNV
jgi:release factor glutamine methyltransferase